jgi:hypothetical protein
MGILDAAAIFAWGMLWVWLAALLERFALMPLRLLSVRQSNA